MKIPAVFDYCPSSTACVHLKANISTYHPPLNHLKKMQVKLTHMVSLKSLRDAELNVGSQWMVIKYLWLTVTHDFSSMHQSTSAIL